MDREALARQVRALAEPRQRLLVGLTGAPGAGKSSLSGWLVARLGEFGLPAAGVPMDGFHLAGAVLQARGSRARKGAPDTFDVHGYLTLLARLRTESHHTVYAPRFHREIEESFAAEIGVEPSVRVVVTEGNYLLLDDGPWASVRTLLDAVWYVEVPEPLRLRRLVRRHRAGGKSEAEAHDWAYGSDQRNAELVAATRSRARGVVSGG